MGHYSEMENYYRSLPESEIAASPSLMQGMSMLCAAAMDYEGSEQLDRELREFWKRCGNRTPQANRRAGVWRGWTFPCRSAA
ncbi:MAG: hypothetical protein ACLUN5_11500 [Oscillospiraceae bacterium]